MIRFCYTDKPMAFRDLKGHRHLLDLLTGAAMRRAVPQSLLFSGPEGVGKRQVAIALAQAVNCTAAQNQSADAGCGECSACRKIARGVHPDVLVLEPGESGSIKVEDVRDAIGRAAYRPFEGQRRVTIVDSADAMVPHAQDALLKTLEEPPPGSIFILISARPDALLPTIRSRCYQLRFGRLDEADVAAILRERHGWSDADAKAAAALADGSVGAALEAESDEAAETRGAAADLLRGVASAKGAGARLDQARDLAAPERDELARRPRAAASMLRDMQLLAARADERLLANADLRDELAGLSSRYDVTRGLDGFDAIDRALAALERNASPKVVADWIALEL
jgi:DNA polymerase III subunit delta'